MRTRRRLPDHLFALRDQYVRAAGEVASVIVETDADVRKVDHVWLQIRAGEFGRLQISLSTCSRQSRAAEFDPRVRVGIITSRWSELPSPEVRVTTPLDYAELEAAQRVDYVSHKRPRIEQLLIAKARHAIFVEAWGEFYIRAHIGVHQIHSRRASFAVPQDFIGRDGAVQFYFETAMREMLLFKFAGQP